MSKIFRKFAVVAVSAALLAPIAAQAGTTSWSPTSTINSHGSTSTVKGRYNTNTQQHEIQVKLVKNGDNHKAYARFDLQTRPGDQSTWSSRGAKYSAGRSHQVGVTRTFWHTQTLSSIDSHARGRYQAWLDIPSHPDKGGSWVYSGSTTY